MSIRIGELFAGYGGLGMGVKAVTGGEVVWVSEIDPGACKVLAHRYPDAPNLGDITKVDWSQVEPVDVACAGFPCTDVSTAGKQAGLIHGTRSGLWHEVVRYVRECRPPLLILENVRGLLSARGDESEELDAAEAKVDRIDQAIEYLQDIRSRAHARGDHDTTRRLDGKAVRLLALRDRAVVARGRAERRVVRAIGTVVGSLADVGYDAVWCGLRAADVGGCHGRFRVFVAAHPGGEHGGQWRESASGQATGGRALGEPARRDRAPVDRLLPTPAVNDMGAGKSPEQWDAWTERMKAEHGNGNGHGASLSIEAMRLLPTPPVMDHASSGGGYNGQTNVTLTDATVRQHDRWGDYADAIHRWERVLGRPAPPPTEPNPKTGRPRLSPRFEEWMMGLPDGWITDVPGVTWKEAVRMCGNGVVPQQAEAATRWLLSVMERTA